MEQEGGVVSVIDKMREAFDSCTVMAGVEPDFECVYITKNAAKLYLAEIEAENAKLRELIADVHDALRADKAGMFHKLILASMEDDMRELGIEVEA